MFRITAIWRTFAQLKKTNMIMDKAKQKIVVKALGVLDYQAAWDYQEQLLKENVQLKARVEGQLPGTTTNYLLFCEHPPVYTIGKSGHMENLLISREELQERGIGFVPTNRGGDITFHGPGQVVGYPILDLENFFTDIGKYLRCLEEVIIRTLAQHGIAAFPGRDGRPVPGASSVPRRSPDSPGSATNCGTSAPSRGTTSGR